MILEIWTSKARIISVGDNDQFDDILFVFVAYWEGQTNRKPTKFVLIYQISNLETGKSEPRYLGIIACIRLYVIVISNIKGMNH